MFDPLVKHAEQLLSLHSAHPKRHPLILEHTATPYIRDLVFGSSVKELRNVDSTELLLKSQLQYDDISTDLNILC